MTSRWIQPVGRILALSLTLTLSLPAPAGASPELSRRTLRASQTSENQKRTHRLAQMIRTGNPAGALKEAVGIVRDAIIPPENTLTPSAAGMEEDVAARLNRLIGPPGNKDNLGEFGSRDVSTRGAAATELIRIGLPAVTPLITKFNVVWPPNDLTEETLNHLMPVTIGPHLPQTHGQDLVSELYRRAERLGIPNVVLDLRDPTGQKELKTELKFEQFEFQEQMRWIREMTGAMKEVFPVQTSFISLSVPQVIQLEGTPTLLFEGTFDLPYDAAREALKEEVSPPLEDETALEYIERVVKIYMPLAWSEKASSVSFHFTGDQRGDFFSEYRPNAYFGLSSGVPKGSKVFQQLRFLLLPFAQQGLLEEPASGLIRPTEIRTPRGSWSLSFSVKFAGMEEASERTVPITLREHVNRIIDRKVKGGGWQKEFKLFDGRRGTFVRIPEFGVLLDSSDIYPSPSGEYRVINSEFVGDWHLSVVGSTVNYRADSWDVGVMLERRNEDESQVLLEADHLQGVWSPRPTPFEENGVRVEIYPNTMEVIVRPSQGSSTIYIAPLRNLLDAGMEQRVYSKDADVLYSAQMMSDGETIRVRSKASFQSTSTTLDIFGLGIELVVEIESISFSDTGAPYLAALLTDGSLLIWDVSTRELEEKIASNDSAIAEKKREYPDLKLRPESPDAAGMEGGRRMGDDELYRAWQIIVARKTGTWIAKVTSDQNPGENVRVLNFGTQKEIVVEDKILRSEYNVLDAGLEGVRAGDRLKEIGVRKGQDQTSLTSLLPPNTWREAPTAAVIPADSKLVDGFLMTPLAQLPPTADMLVFIERGAPVSPNVVKALEARGILRFFEGTPPIWEADEELQNIFLLHGPRGTERQRVPAAKHLTTINFLGADPSRGPQSLRELATLVKLAHQQPGFLLRVGVLGIYRPELRNDVIAIDLAT